GLAHPELGLLLVGLAVARLALDDLVELDRRRIEVLAVVQLERALENLRRLIAGCPFLGNEVASGLLLLRHGERAREQQRTRQQQADDADSGHKGTSLFVRGS